MLAMVNHVFEICLLKDASNEIRQGLEGLQNVWKVCAKCGCCKPKIAVLAYDVDQRY